ncbi:MAG: lipopolysaccharide biosynthesis protein, partial [Roseibium sp.]|uniref:lipopolysaccharide biosynthesis protein n=1 Tax=Roseibium sp. TaxID=1936156 RepID=UPI002622A028
MIKKTLQDKLLKKFLGQSGIAFGIRVAWAVVSYAGVVFLARWLDPADYGTYAFLISLITFLAVVCSFGSPTALIRFLGEYRGQNKSQLIGSVIRVARRSVAIATVLVALSGAVFFSVWSMVDTGLQPVVFIIGMCLLPAFAMAEVQGAISRSFGSVVAALGPRDVFWRLALIPLGFFATRYFVKDMQLTVFMSGAVLCLWLFVACQWVYVRKLLPPAVPQASSPDEMSTWRQVAIPIWFAAIAVVSFRTVDVLFLGVFVSQEDVGKYFAASRTASLVSFVLIS